MHLQVATRLVDVELGQRYVVGTGTGDEHVVDPSRQLVEEPAEPAEIGGVESGDAAAELEAGPLDPLGVACGDDHLGSLVVRPSGRFEADARAPANHQERFTGELTL